MEEEAEENMLAVVCIFHTCVVGDNHQSEGCAPLLHYTVHHTDDMEMSIVAYHQIFHRKAPIDLSIMSYGYHVRPHNHVILIYRFLELLDLSSENQLDSCVMSCHCCS